MSEKLNKITSLISVVLFALAIVAGGYFYTKVMTMEPVPENVVVPSEKVSWAMDRIGGSLAFFLDISYVMLASSLVAILVFGILGTFKNAKSIKNGLVTLGFFGGIFIISFLVSTSEIPVFFGYEKFNLTEGVARAIDIGLKSMYILFVLAVGGVVYTGVRSIFVRK